MCGNGDVGWRVYVSGYVYLYLFMFMQSIQTLRSLACVL